MEKYGKSFKVKRPDRQIYVPPGRRVDILWEPTAKDEKPSLEKTARIKIEQIIDILDKHNITVVKSELDNMEITIKVAKKTAIDNNCKKITRELVSVKQNLEVMKRAISFHLNMPLSARQLILSHFGKKEAMVQNENSEASRKQHYL